MLLSIIIPVYNEQATVIQTLKKVIDGVSSIDNVEIIVVNDGSTDDTLLELRSFYLKDENRSKFTFQTYDANKGKGHAVKCGFHCANGDIVVIFDADDEYDIADVIRMYRIMEEYKFTEIQVLYGTRFRGDNKKTHRQHKGSYYFAYLGGRLITWFTNFLYGSNITDEATCLKMFRKEIIDNIDIKNDRFNLEPEITAKILKKGIKIYEMPISYNPRTKEEGKHINWKDGVSALWTLLKYKFVD